MGVFEIAVLVGLAGVAVAVFLHGRRDGQQQDGDGALAQRVAEMAEHMKAENATLAARLDRLAQSGQDSQRALSDSLGQRLDGIGQRVGSSLHESTKQTLETMGKLQERLAAIDAAQQNIQSLGSQIVGLQDILSDKQSRGAFGEMQLADLVSDILPPSAYALQATLDNGNRPDCLLKLPNPPGAIAVDAKFPLDGYRRLQDAATPEEKARAGRGFRDDVAKHIRDIADKYIVPGETADQAIMFLPSEAVYAELHARHGGVVEESFRRRVFIVSPTTLMATLNTVRAVLKDARMREQAGRIQQELMKVMDDVRRLDERVGQLGRHFGQAEEDVRQIGISTGKIVAKAEKIAELEMEEEDAPPALAEGGGGGGGGGEELFGPPEAVPGRRG